MKKIYTFLQNCMFMTYLHIEPDMPAYNDSHCFYQTEG
jgi:hypothetical protein